MKRSCILLKIESSMNQLSVADRSPVKQREDIKPKENEQTQQAKETVRTDVQAVSRTDKVEPSAPAKVESRERVEMSTNEMKLRTEGLKANQAQDTIASHQVAEKALSSMKEQGESLKELSSKHQEAKPEEKAKIELQAKDVLAKMNQTAESATFRGDNVVEGKHEAKIPKDVEKVEMKEVLKPENIEKNITKPLEEATAKVSGQTEQLVASLSASQVVSMTKTDANQAMQKVKDSLKDSDVRKVASGLDSRRENVAHLLK